MFEAVSKEATLASRVRDEVERLIIEEHLQPGDRLPPERDLAQRFAVSRTVVREAIRGLAARGMLDVRQGSGTTVQRPSIESLTPPLVLLLKGQGGETDPSKIMEVRRTMEVQVAGIAAERRTAADLEKLAGILETHAKLEEDRVQFIALDMAFHGALARATQNELFSLLHDSVAAVLRKVREVGYEVPGTIQRALTHHRAIFKQVEKGSAEGARKAMAEHIAEAELTMAKGMKLREQAAKKA